MKRTSINPTDWSIAFSYDQGEVVEGITRLLNVSGQVSVAPDPESEMGIKILHPGEIRAQMEEALASIDVVLEKAGMTRANILTVRSFTTDMDGFLANYDVYVSWIGEAAIRPPQSLLGVAKLFHPEVVVEIEVSAGA